MIWDTIALIMTSLLCHDHVPLFHIRHFAACDLPKYSPVDIFSYGTNSCISQVLIHMYRFCAETAQSQVLNINIRVTNLPLCIRVLDSQDSCRVISSGRPFTEPNRGLTSRSREVS